MQRDAERCSHRFWIARRSQRYGRRNEPRNILPACAALERDSPLADWKIGAQACARIEAELTAQHPRRAKNRMAGERDLARGCEHPHAVAAIRLWRWRDESRF